MSKSKGGWIMKKKNKYTHVLVKGKNGADYLCPVNSGAEKGNAGNLDENVCVEKHVPGRYAAKIIIQSS